MPLGWKWKVDKPTFGDEEPWMPRIERCLWENFHTGIQATDEADFSKDKA
jgi:hypothetical protein